MDTLARVIVIGGYVLLVAGIGLAMRGMRRRAPSQLGRLLHVEGALR